MEPITESKAPVIQPSLADLDKLTPPPPPPPAPGAVADTPPPPAPPPPPGSIDPIQQKIDEENKKKAEEEASKKAAGNTDAPVEEEEEDPMLFYAEVSKLRGDNFEWQFPEGIDPTTPQGLHHAIGQVVNKELDIFEENLQKGDPRAYAYMLHRSHGGSDEDFFKVKTEVLPEWETLKGSVDLQQQFYKRVLTRKDILPDQAEMIVKDAIEKNKLPALVEIEYNRMKKQDEDQAREMLRISEQNQKREQQIIQKMGTTLQEKIIQNKGLDIIIPDTKRSEFLEFMNSLMHLDNQTGRWFLQQEITSENMNQIIEAMYFLKVGGNLNEIISNRAKEENTKALKLRLKSDKTPKSTVVDPRNIQNKPGVQPALSEL